MSSVAIYATVDDRQFQAALAVALKFSTRAPEKVIDSTAYHVVKRTIELTPHVSIAKMDMELGTAVAVRPNKRGTGILTAKKSQRYVSGNLISMSRGGKTHQVPLAALIVNAQVIRPDIGNTPSSKNYNRRTNFRFARQSSPFRGVTRAAGRAAMRAAVHRLIAARHSSSKFLVAGWSVVRKALLGRVYGGVPATDAGGVVKNKHFGEITRSGGGASGNYSLEIANLIGMEPGQNGSNAANYNAALHRYGGPALQQAIDEQAESMLRHYWDRMIKEDLAPKWDAVR